MKEKKTKKKTRKYKEKKQTGGFLDMLLGTLGATMLEKCLLKKESWKLREDKIACVMWIKSFSFAPSFKQCPDYYIFQLLA